MKGSLPEAAMPETDAIRTRHAGSLAGPRVAPLRHGEVHLWCVSLDAGQELLESCTSALTRAENERISYYAFRQAQESYAISQGGLRLLLSSYLGLSPQAIQLERHAKGKPHTPDDRSLFFNLSNSGRYCVYAFSRAGEVGIDIEAIRDLPDLQQLIDTNFTDREKEYINRIPEKRADRFFQFWTVKEAYVKAVGEGMRLTPSSVEFSVDNNGFSLESIMGVQEHEDWQCSVFAPGPGYMGAIVYKGPHTKIAALEYL